MAFMAISTVRPYSASCVMSWRHGAYHPAPMTTRDQTNDDAGAVTGTTRIWVTEALLVKGNRSLQVGYHDAPSTGQPPAKPHIGLAAAARLWITAELVNPPKALRMNDNAMQPADLLRSRLEDMLALLDQHDLTLAAAWLTMAINAIPIGCDHG